MDEERLVVIGASAGIVGVLSFQVLFSISLLVHPDWRFGLDLMSELGTTAPHTWLFNLSVIVMGTMGVAFSLSLLRFLYWSFFGKLSVAILVAGCTCLFLLGVFTMEQRALHDALAWAFFVLTVIGLMAMSIPMYVHWNRARLAFAATLATVAWHGKRLTALIVIGATGLMVSAAFAMLSAPDLALTQLLVEMVTIAMMMMALNYLPKQSKQARTPFRRWRDALISVVAGAGCAGLAYAMLVREPDQALSAELLARSLPEAYGANVVNVILVDFRGFDTFGEITVFAVAALVVHAMLRWARLRPDEVIPGPPVQLPIPADLTQLLFPLALTVSIYLFLRGHNAPGGGFIAGLTIAVPVLIKYVLQGARAVESTFGFDYVRGISLGLALAAAGGLGSLLFGLPFLASGHLDLELPVIGHLPLASALVFDTGVYVVVFAGALLILSTMGTVRRRTLEAEAMD